MSGIGTPVGAGGVLSASQYVLEIDGETDADPPWMTFSEVVGVSMEIPAAEQRVATGKGKVELLSYPANPKYGEITLRMGWATKKLYTWIQEIADNKFEGNMKTGVIKVYDGSGALAESWDIVDAWPTKWELGELKGGANTIRVESLTLNIVKIKPSPPEVPAVPPAP